MYRGGDGPLGVRTTRYDDPLVDGYLAAGAAMGYPITGDYNGARQEGFGRLQLTIRNGRRCSASAAYLEPAKSRSNLTIKTNVLCSKVLFEGAVAAGVEYRESGALRTARARREVILAAGAFNSPQLLMLSGIGEPAELAAQGIACRIPLQGVGKNLQDHIAAGVGYARREPGPFCRNMRADRIALGIMRAYALGTGFAADVPSGWMAFVKMDDAIAPDLQLMFRAAPKEAAPYTSRPYDDGFMCRATLLHPRSRGDVTLRSADPRDAPRIRKRFLTQDADRNFLRRGIRFVRELGAQRSLAPFVARELGPGPQRTSDVELDEYIRTTLMTAHHPAGTCKMGIDSDEDAVVDPHLRVRGAERLRIVDASVMPDLVGGNINAAVYMIAEKAADMILGRPAPAPAALPNEKEQAQHV